MEILAILTRDTKIREQKTPLIPPSHVTNEKTKRCKGNKQKVSLDTNS